MNYSIGKSTLKDASAAVREATSELKSPKLVLFFSGVESFEGYAMALHQKYPDAITMGATTFAAFSKEGAYKETLMILGFEDGIRCEAGLIEEVEKYPLGYIERIQKSASSFRNAQNTMCLEISSALISCEELVLSTLNAVLGDKGIPVFGGSSGDRGCAEKTLIAYKGKVYQNATAYCLIENQKGKIRFYRENIYKPTEHRFKTTKVDVRNRIVYEYDHKPAAKVMANAMGVSVSELPKYLDSYPMGRIVGNEMYIVANNSIVKGDGMAYHARIYNNAEVVLLEPDDYKAVIHRTLTQVKSDCSKPQLTLMVNCLARSMLFESNGYLQEFAKKVGGTLGNYIGFAGYGEQLGEQHFNQTMVLAVFE